MKNAFILTLIFALISEMALAQDLPAHVPLEDFAYKAEIESADNQSLVRFDLSEDAYSHIEGSALEDVRIFNAAGQALPFVVWQQKNQLEQTSNFVSIPFFPILHLAEEGVLQKLVTQNHGDEKIQQQNIQKLYDEKVNGFLLDVRTLSGAIRSLRFSWDNTHSNFVHQVAVEASSDLEHWVPVNPQATLATFSYNQETLVHDKVEFLPRQAAYFRVRFLDEVASDELNLLFQSIEAEVVSSENRMAPLMNKTVAGRDGGGAYGHQALIYDLGGHLPLQALRYQGEGNHYYWKIHLYSSDDEQSLDWQDQGVMTVYRIEQQLKTIESDPIALHSRHRFWKVVFNEGAFPGEGFALEFSYLPETLVFMPQGPAPYTLALGYKNLSPVQYDLAGLLALKGDQNDLAGVPSASLGVLEKQRDGVLDAQKIVAAKIEAQKHKRSWVVWSVLLACVAFMGFMAFRLFRQMNKK